MEINCKNLENIIVKIKIGKYLEINSENMACCKNVENYFENFYNMCSVAQLSYVTQLLGYFLTELTYSINFLTVLTELTYSVS